MADQKIGVITHYFGKISVAAFKAESPFSVGDTVKFVRHGQELFTQTVTSIQEEHKVLEKADAGQDIAIKVDKPVHEGVEVYKA